MNTEIRPKGWHSAVRHILNGFYDAYDALRRNNSGASHMLLMLWLWKSAERAVEKFRAAMQKEMK